MAMRAAALLFTLFLVADVCVLLHSTLACDVTVPIKWNQNGKTVSGVMKSTDSQSFKIQRFELSFAGVGGSTVTQVVLRLFERPIVTSGTITVQSSQVQFGSDCGACTQKIIDETWPAFPCNSAGSFSFGSPLVTISWDQAPAPGNHTMQSLLADWDSLQCPLSCSREADIVFLVDASGSIDCPDGSCSGDTSNGPNWKRIVSFLNNVTDRFTIGSDATRFGIVYFAGSSNRYSNDQFCLSGNAAAYDSTTADKSSAYIYRYYPEIEHQNGFPDYSMKTSSAYKCWTNDVQNAQDGGYASVELALSGNSTFVHSVTNSLTNSRVSTYEYTAMGTGVQLVSRVFTKDPARRNVSKILITLTDGNNNRGISPQTAVQGLFNQVSGISALVIGVGSQINDATLLTMTNNMSSNVFRISDFTEFESIINSLVGLSCLSSGGASDTCGGQCDTFCSPCGCQCMCSVDQTCTQNGVCVDVSPSPSPPSSPSVSPTSSPSSSPYPSPSQSPSPTATPSPSKPSPVDSGGGGGDTAAIAGGVAGGAALVALVGLSALAVGGGFIAKRVLFRTEPPTTQASEVTVQPEALVQSNPLASQDDASGVNPFFISSV